jgi:hypothetical protein
MRRPCQNPNNFPGGLTPGDKPKITLQMRLKLLVMEEGAFSRTFDGKTRTGYELSLRDQCDGVRCKSNLTMELETADQAKYAGKLRDKIIEVDVSELRGGSNGGVSIRGAFVGLAEKKP